MKDLMLEIEQAENAWREAEQLQEGLLKLSTNEIATDVLATELRDAAIRCETLWREIEQRDDFIAKYGTDRELARDELLFSGR